MLLLFWEGQQNIENKCHKCTNGGRRSCLKKRGNTNREHSDQNPNQFHNHRREHHQASDSGNTT